MMATRGRELVLAVVVAVALFVSPASAATYTVWSCRDAVDRPAPASDTGGGWTASGTGLPGRDASDLCDSSVPRLTASIAGPWAFSVGTAVTWRFTPPPNTYLAGIRLVYSGYARPFNGQNEGLVEVWGSSSGLLARHQGVGAFGATAVAGTDLHDTWAAVRIYCDGPTGNPDCQPGQAHSAAPSGVRR
jgi:hypothetical protein